MMLCEVGVGSEESDRRPESANTLENNVRISGKNCSPIRRAVRSPIWVYTGSIDLSVQTN